MCNNKMSSQGNGLPCVGDDFKHEPCNTHSCQLPEEYLWSPWGECSKKCGQGVKKRHSMCGTVRNKAFVTKDFPEDAVTTTEAINPTTIKDEDGMTTTYSKTEGIFLRQEYLNNVRL